MADYRYPKHAIVSIWHKKEVDDVGIFLGSGAFVSPHLVLTAKHVVDENKSTEGFYLRLIDGHDQDQSAGEIYRHDEFDIAVVQMEIDFPNQGLVKLDLNDPSLRNKTVALYAVSPVTKNRDEAEVKVGDWNNNTHEYIFHHRQPKGFSGGIAVYNGRAVGVITRRHEDEQLGTIIPLHLVRDWLAKILSDATRVRYFPPNPPAIQPRPRQAQTEFTRRVREEIGKLFGRRKLGPLRTALSGRLPEDSTPEKSPENLLLPLQESLSIESSSRPLLESSIRTLHAATRECLQQLSDQDPEAAQAVKTGATDVLGWLVLLAVSEDWLQKNAEQWEHLLNTQYIEIPLKTETGAAVVVARLRKHPARFKKDCVPIDGAYRITVGKLELGADEDDVLIELKRLIWSAVCEEPLPHLFDEDAEIILKSTLEFRNEDGEHYYITIPASRYPSAAGGVSLLARLSHDLPYLGAFLIGVENGDRVLVIEEPRFVTLVQEFFRMLRKFP